MTTRLNEYDVLVVGTGAAGMAAAVTAAHQGLKVLVVEKALVYGGTTAKSGGWVWVPGTRLAIEQGIIEQPGAARTYLQHEAGEHFDPARVDAFLENGPKAIDFFTRETCVQFDMQAPLFPDYHPEAPGGVAGGRSMLTRTFDARELGEHGVHLAPPLPELTVFGMMLGSGQELRHFLYAFKSFKSFRYVVRRFGRHFLEVMRYGRGMTLTFGTALAGRLVKAAMDKGVPVWLSSPVTKLVVEDDRVVGAVVSREGTAVEVRARRGVVLACGGFSHDIERRKQLYPHALTGREHFTPVPAANTGDGLRLGESVGGWVDPTIPNAAAWTPTSVVPRKNGATSVMPHFVDRAKPAVIAITADGQRFTNESASYHDFGEALIKAWKTKRLNECSAWLICDHHHLREYGLGPAPKWPLPYRKYVRSGYMKRAATLDELAKAMNVPAETLKREVETFNRDAAIGTDTRFGKGGTAYNRYQGDVLNKPNPCMSPIVNAPFYAIKIGMGDIGTFAGLATDASCRVLTKDGRVVPGLYAVGNDAASIMGGNYPGGGITLGPCLTFGWTVAMHLAEAERHGASSAKQLAA